MALTKTEEVDQIEVVGPYKKIQVRTATVVREDGTELSRSFRRKVLAPGSVHAVTGAYVEPDVSSEDATVQAIAGSAWTKAIKDAWYIEDKKNWTAPS